MVFIQEEWQNCIIYIFKYILNIFFKLNIGGSSCVKGIYKSYDPNPTQPTV